MPGSTIKGPRLAGVLGQPVAHSLSPVIHGHWFAAHGIDGAYVRLPVDPADLAAVVATLPKMGFSGVNVTIPHKLAMVELVDERDPAASRMGAVNTVLFQEDGRSMGLNTDGLGFAQALIEAVPAFGDPQAVAQMGPVVLLGTGGAAQAVASALIDLGITGLRLSNRTQSRAEELAALAAGWTDRPVSVIPWAERAAALGGAGLLVNCTSLGMRGQPDLEVAIDDLPLTSPVFDIVYNPLHTPLLQAAAERGQPVIDGLGMLLHQAVPGFCHWGGVTPLVDQALRTAVLDRLK